MEDLSASSAGLSDAGTWILPWSIYDIASGETRPAAGNFDDDPASELVVGLGRGGRGYLAVLDDAAHGRRLLQWIRVPWSLYDAGNGEGWPACGDIDGDGRDEIVVGLGAGGGGCLDLFHGRAGSFAHGAWMRLPWAAYDAALGESHPAMGDTNGDGRADLVAGLGAYPSSGGWLASFTSTGSALVPSRWVRVPWTAYDAANGEAWPACGDVNGDGRPEVVVGLGSHPRNGGWLLLLGDARSGFATRGWYHAGWSAYDALNGEIHPALACVDGDGRCDLVVGTGSGGGERVGLALSTGRGFGTMRWFQVPPLAGSANDGTTWPALGAAR